MVLYRKESSNILFHFILITYVLKFLFLSFLILFLKSHYEESVTESGARFMHQVPETVTF